MYVCGPICGSLLALCGPEHMTAHQVGRRTLLELCLLAFACSTREYPRAFKHAQTCI